MAPIDGNVNVTFENASEILKREEFKDLTARELMILVATKSDLIDANEVAKKSLEFEKDTFKINSRDWQEVTKEDKRNPILAKFIGKEQTVKVNATWDVLEYLEWPAKWEQIFLTYEALIREVKKAKNCTREEVETKYLMTIDDLKKKMKYKPDDSEEYKEFFTQELNWHLSGCWSPNDKTFYGVGTQSTVWLSGGYSANFTKNGWIWDDDITEDGYSGRLLKN